MGFYYTYSSKHGQTSRQYNSILKDWCDYQYYIYLILCNFLGASDAELVQALADNHLKELL